MTTTVREADPQVKDDPRRNNASHLRAIAEEYHYEREHRYFVMPFQIKPASPTDGTRELAFKDFFYRNILRWFDSLNVDDCRLFCWKDCAIYSNNKDMLSDHLALLDAIYREWFPHRARDHDVRDGSFFAKLLSFTRSAVGPLQETLRFHEALCEKLGELERVMPETVPIHPATARRWEAIPKVVEYKLRETFRVVFIVVDAGWQEHGVLLVWKSEGDALRHNCKEGGEISRYECSDGSDLGQARVFQCPLKRAMQLVVSTDPERAKPRAEYNEMLEEILGEDPTTMRSSTPT